MGPSATRRAEKTGGLAPTGLKTDVLLVEQRADGLVAVGVADRLREQRLTTTGGPEEEHTATGLHPEVLELLRVLDGVLDQLLQLALDALEPADGDLAPAAGFDPDVTVAAMPDAAQLADLLANDRRVPACVTEKLMTYALGRGLESYDMPTVRKIVRDAARDDYRFSAIATGIVNSVPFRMRRAQDPAAPAATTVAQARD